jgi:hypothetical protein
MEQTSELAAKLGIPERDFYTDKDLKEMAWSYARFMLKSKEVITLSNQTRALMIIT